MSGGKPIRSASALIVPRSDEIEAKTDTIREIRLAWNASQGRLAQIAGCNQGTVSRWESGFRMKRLWGERLRRGAKAHGLPWRPEWSQALGMDG